LKIAVPTDDGVAFAAHTGRAAGFAVFEIADGAILSTEMRWKEILEGVSAPAHSHPHNDHNCGAGGEHQGHSHNEILDIISDCKALLAVGAGPRLIMDLRRRGIEVLFCSYPTAKAAAEAFAGATFEALGESGCDCHSHRH